MDLNDCTIDQLLHEIKKRQDEERLKSLPHVLPDEKIINQFKQVKDFLRYNLKNIAEKGYAIDDFKQYCFEMILEMFYGKEIWEWYNKYNKD